MKSIGKKFSTINEVLQNMGKTATKAQLTEHQQWREALKELDREIINNDRRHETWRDRLDTTIVDREPEEDEYVSATDLLKLSAKENDWIEYIFSQRFEDLPELVVDRSISEALKTLTDKQKEVLYHYEVLQYRTADIVAKLGSSERNIRGHREAALKKIRKYLAQTD